MALFIVLTAVLSVLSFSLVRGPTLPSVYHALHCLAFVVLFVLLAAKVYIGNANKTQFFKGNLRLSKSTFLSYDIKE